MNFMFYRADSFNQDISSWDIRSVRDMECIFEDTKNFNRDLTIWQALNDDLDESVLEHCSDLKDLTSEYINNYLSKRELELREELTKTGRLGLLKTHSARKKKDLQTIDTDSSSIQVRQYELLSNFKVLKDRLEAVDIEILNKGI
jgi:surface protein